MNTERHRSRLAVTPLNSIEVRDASGTGDGSWTVEGYAAVYDQETVLFDVPGWVRMRERVKLGALSEVIERVRHGAELVHLNHGHDMKTAVASSKVTGIGGLELADDFHGMRFFARVDQEDPDARSMAVKMRRKILDQASFAFDIGEDTLVESRELDDGTLDQLWEISSVAHLYDVCVCAQGAYPQTEAHLRSLAAASMRVADLSPSSGRAELPAGRGHRSVEEGAGEVAPEAGLVTGRLALLRATASDVHRRLKLEGAI